MESEKSRQRRLDLVAILEREGLKSYCGGEDFTPNARAEVGLVLVWDNSSTVVLEWCQPKVEGFEKLTHKRCEHHSIPRAVEVFGTQYVAYGKPSKVFDGISGGLHPVELLMRCLRQPFNRLGGDTVT